MSDRSVAYLASGRPVLMEDTGLSNILPVDAGLLYFNDLESALARMCEMFANYERHSRAARSIAEEFSSTLRVLPRLLETTFGR